MKPHTRSSESSGSAAASVAPPVPNLFHFVFGLQKQKEPFHLVHYLCLESCLQVNEPDQVFFHYHYEPYGPYWDRIKNRITPVQVDLQPFVQDYRYRDRGIKKYSYAHQADFIRIDKLIEHGGVYADIDSIFVNPLPDPLFHQSFVLGREDDVVCQDTGQIRRSLCNALIMSTPGSPFARLWRARMEEAFNGSWSNHCTLLPHVLSEERPDWIHVEPSRSFYNFMWTRDGIHTLLEGCDTDLEGVYSIHLWAHLWWEKKRRDFSDFHVGMITEKNIREKDTTYNLIARRFLP